MRRRVRGAHRRPTHLVCPRWPSHSMDFRIGCRRSSVQEIEIAAFVGLRDMPREKRAIPSTEARRRGFPLRATLREIGIAHLELELAFIDVELDQVTVLHER